MALLTPDLLDRLPSRLTEAEDEPGPPLEGPAPPGPPLWRVPDLAFPERNKSN